MPAIEHDPLAKLREWVHNGKLRWEAHHTEPGKVGFQYTGDANDAPEGMFTDEHGYVATANANQWMNHLNDNLAEPEDREATPETPTPANPPIESAENEGQPNVPTLPEGATESTSPVQSQSPAPAPAPPVVEPSPPSAPVEPASGPEAPALEDTASAAPGVDVAPTDLAPGDTNA